MDVNQFLRVIGQCGKNYLRNSGPTSRLEDKISAVGKSYGVDVQVWSTPTGLFLSVKDDYGTTTSLERIRDTQYNFSDMLFFGNLLDQLEQQSIDLDEAEKQLGEFKTQRFPVYIVALCGFLIGATASFMRFGIFYGAVVSGLITCFVYIVQRPMARKFKYSGVFSDFMGCLLAFVLSLFMVSTTAMPFMVFAMGSILLIVPGLTLTAAISELAEHNFVSGTVKLMKAILILVAMGVAYLLVENLVFSFHLPETFVTSQVMPADIVNQQWFQMVARTVLISAFCIFFHIPIRALPGAIVCGLCSLIVLEQVSDPKFYVLSSFLASFSVGIISLFLSRLYKWPSQIFSTPGILSLVPGLLALSIFYNVSSAEDGQIAYRVALSAGAIVFGLLSARMPFRFYTDEEM